MLKAGVEVCLESELTNNGVVMAVDVGIDTVHPLEDLPNHAWEGLGEWDTFLSSVYINIGLLQNKIPILLGKTDSLSMLL